MTVVGIARGIRWYVRALMGEDAYEKYLAHGEGEPGGGVEPLSEREFWRDRTDRQDANPEGRCC